MISGSRWNLILGSPSVVADRPIVWLFARHCEPIGRANARSIERSNPSPPQKEKLDCFVTRAPCDDGWKVLILSFVLEDEDREPANGQAIYRIDRCKKTGAVSRASLGVLASLNWARARPRSAPSCLRPRARGCGSDRRTHPGRRTGSARRLPAKRNGRCAT